MTVRHAAVNDMEDVRSLLRKYHRDSVSEEDRPDGSVAIAITDERLAFVDRINCRS